MKTLESIFDNIGRVITSLAAVIFVMLMTISGMIFFSHTLFIQVFPISMTTWEKFTATWLMALGWEFTVLITTCNTRHINRHIPLVMAVASGVIVLFFIQAFDGTQPAITLAQRWFVGILAATINYTYAELFYAKWKERNDQQELPTKLAEKELSFIQLQAQTDRAIANLQSELNDAQSAVNESGRQVKALHADLAQAHTELDELKRYKARFERDLTCPHCKLVQDSYGTLQAHKGYCAKNPNKRGAKQLNGAAH